MLPVVTNFLCVEGRQSSYPRVMPKVVPDQREKFENDELFRKLSRECEVRYTGHRDRPLEERQFKCRSECAEGHADICFVGAGTNLCLVFCTNSWSETQEDRIPTKEFVDFDEEQGKVHLKSQLILNGVCVVWRGYIDLQRLDGTGWIEYDDERAAVEDTILREQIQQYNQRIHDFESRQRHYQQEQERQAETEAEVVQALLNFSEKHGAEKATHY